MSKHLKRVFLFAALATLTLALVIVGQGLAEPTLTPIQELGRELYFDENLSEPAGQSCASCHEPDFGFVDPDKGKPVSEGVIPGLFGGRNSPASAYAMYAPIRYFDGDEGLWIGGQFWDSRATGDVLGDPLADQALGPFLNPVEMANTSKAQVIADVAASDYAALFEEVWGPGLWTMLRLPMIRWRSRSPPLSAPGSLASSAPSTTTTCRPACWQAGI